MAKNDDGTINHLVSLRLRVTGDGNLRLFARSYDDVRNQTFVPIILEATTDRMPNQLANFRSQAIQIEFKTTAIDEVFALNSIIAYVKPVAVGYPQ